MRVCLYVPVMRVQGSLRVVLNTMIWPSMLVERSSKRSVRISAVDADDGIKIYLIQVSQSLSTVKPSPYSKQIMTRFISCLRNP